MTAVAVVTIGNGGSSELLKAAFAEIAAQDRHQVHRLVSAEQAAILLFVDLHEHPADARLGALFQTGPARERPESVRVLDIRDRPFFTFPGIYPSWPAGRRGSRFVRGGVYPFLPTAERGPRDPAVTPDGGLPLLFSFVGAVTHPIRREVLRLQDSRAHLEDTTGAGVVLASHHASERRARFANILQASRFVLCPRGHGTSSFRIFEVMQAGRVPVIISDGWLPPDGVDWQACTVRVRERDVHRIPDILHVLDRQWTEMAAAAATAWRERFAPAARWHTWIEALDHIPGGWLRAPELQHELLRQRYFEAKGRLLGRRDT